MIVLFRGDSIWLRKVQDLYELQGAIEYCYREFREGKLSVLTPELNPVSINTLMELLKDRLEFQVRVWLRNVYEELHPD